ncbi:MAG: MBL fold metallo-hydrolase [Lachnospiraceae bacterium]|nr:MBL fold metallo-hydrolase [Lachnospiraceae bacterium]
MTKAKSIKKRILLFGVISVILLVLCACTLPFRKQPEPVNLPEGSYFEIHFLDVGQGDASLILCDGEAMLIDGGGSEESSFIYSYLENHNITHLKYIIGTHPDADHIGGLSGALNYADAEIAYCSEEEYDTATFHNFKKYLDKNGITLQVPKDRTELTLGAATGKIIGPVSSEAEGNNNSLMLRLEYGNTSFLFTGDAEWEEEAAVLAGNKKVRSTVLKVGHHGSKYSSSRKFLEAVSPKYGVISAGKDNSYGHPHPSLLNRMEQEGIFLFRTDLQGNILCISDGQTVSFSVEKNPDADVYEATNSYTADNID